MAAVSTIPVFAVTSGTVAHNNLPTATQLSLYSPPPPSTPHPPPQPLHVIGSGNLIYVSLEIEILTFALCS